MAAAWPPLLKKRLSLEKFGTLLSNSVQLVVGHLRLPRTAVDLCIGLPQLLTRYLKVLWNMVTLPDFSPCADRVAKCLDVEQKEKCTFKMIMNHLNDLHSAGVEANLKYRISVVFL